MKTDRVVTLGLVALISGYFTVELPSAIAAEGFLSNKTAAEKEQIISKMDGPAMLRLAAKHGIHVIQGKDITTPSKSTSAPAAFADRPVGTDPAIEENEPSIAPQDSVDGCATTAPSDTATDSPVN